MGEDQGEVEQGGKRAGDAVAPSSVCSRPASAHSELRRQDDRDLPATQHDTRRSSEVSQIIGSAIYQGLETWSAQERHQTLSPMDRSWRRAAENMAFLHQPALQWISCVRSLQL